MIAKYDSRNPGALKKLVANGAKLHAYPQDVLTAAHTAAFKLYDETQAANANFKTVYDNWKAYLGPLGVKKARIQGGWAKTEKVKGTFDYAWLDHVIFDMAAQGIAPWMCLCHGNRIYGGGCDPTSRVARDRRLPPRS